MSAVLHDLFQLIEARREQAPPGSYTATLLRDPHKAAQKVGEEAVEVVIAALAQSDERLIAESADLLYHLLVLLAARGVGLTAVEAELAARRR